MIFKDSKTGKQLHPNEQYRTAQRSIEKLVTLLCNPHLGIVFKLEGADWFSVHNLCRGFTHRILGIDAYIERPNDQERREASEA